MFGLNGARGGGKGIGAGCYASRDGRRASAGLSGKAGD
jgi:hypothetical protein